MLVKYTYQLSCLWSPTARTACLLYMLTSHALQHHSVVLVSIPQDAVAAGGPLLVLAGFLIFPLIWSVPEALITAELATAFPENSGYVAWVTAAFGPFWGFQEGFWSWLSGVTDNSIYPVMFADNLRIFFPALNDGWPR